MSLVLGLALAASAATPVAGHDLGKTQVDVLLRPDATYVIDVVVDPDDLLSQLELLSGSEPAPFLPRAETSRRIRELSDVWLARAEVRFDGVRVLPAFEYVPPEEASGGRGESEAGGLIRLSGPVPASANSLQWKHGLAAGLYPLKVMTPDGPGPTMWLVADETSPPIPCSGTPQAPDRWSAFGTYLALGFTHILPKGLDHILFVIGLFLLSARWAPVLLQVTAFTVAHSITLALAILGIVSLPAAVVEPLIALSIAYVAIENLVTTRLTPWRLGLVFSFGLLHGLGFAGVLEELGLPSAEFLTALVGFNLGVEAGQLVVVLLTFVAVARWRGETESYQRWVVVPASVGIAIIGMYWTVERLVT